MCTCMWSVLDRIVLTREEEEVSKKEKEKENKNTLSKLHVNFK